MCACNDFFEVNSQGQRNPKKRVQRRALNLLFHITDGLARETSLLRQYIKRKTRLLALLLQKARDLGTDRLVDLAGRHDEAIRKKSVDVGCQNTYNPHTRENPAAQRLHLVQRVFAGREGMRYGRRRFDSYTIVMKTASFSLARRGQAAPSRNRRLLWLLAAAFLLLPQSLRAQGAPDIVWQTNANTAPVTSIAFSADGGLLASAEESDGLVGRVRLWRVDTRELVRTLTRSYEDFLAVAFSPDETLLASGGGGSERDEGKVRIWQVADGAHLRSVGCCRNDYVSALDFSADGSVLGWVSSSGNRLQLMIVADGSGGGSSDESPHAGGARSIRFSPADQSLLTAGADGLVKLWDYTNRLSDQTLLQTYSEHLSGVNAVAFLPNGIEAASAGDDGRIIIRRLTDGSVRTVLQDTGAVVSIAVSADGKTVLTAGTDIKFWRLSDGKLLRTYDQQTQGVTSLAATKDGKYFAYSRRDGTILLAYMPLWITDASLNGKKITLRWQGGSGLYRVQARPRLDKGRWHYLGSPTTNTTFTHSARSRLFYRVVSLPNP